MPVIFDYMFVCSTAHLFSNPTWNSYSYHFMVQLAAGSTRLVTCYKLRIFFPFRSCELRDLWEVAGCYWCWLGKAVVRWCPTDDPHQTGLLQYVLNAEFLLGNYSRQYGWSADWEGFMNHAQCKISATRSWMRWKKNNEAAIYNTVRTLGRHWSCDANTMTILL